MKKATLIGIIALLLTACHSTKSPTSPTLIARTHPAITPTATAQVAVQPSSQQNQHITQTVQPTAVDTAIAFSITGKIGINTQTKQGKQAVSAFYAWAQENERFAIDLTGAMGLGATQIRFDGQTATLTSEKTGTITATSPEQLLFKATGLHAPISKLPYWIIGKNTPDDSDSQFDKNRLVSTKNGEWTANFEYANAQSSKPNRLKIQHTDGHRVVLSINQ